jgi:hypothetical protein
LLFDERSRRQREAVTYAYAGRECADVFDRRGFTAVSKRERRINDGLASVIGKADVHTR